MKKAASIIAVVVVSVAALSFTGRTQSNPGASMPSSSQRYAIVSTSSGQFTETYVLDAQTGRLWMVHGQASKSPYLIPCQYQLLDGRTTLSPIDMQPAQVGRWLKAPNPAFDGSTPLQLVERGEMDRLWRMLFDFESGQPG